jgi:hypothetical protein
MIDTARPAPFDPREYRAPVIGEESRRTAVRAKTFRGAALRLIGRDTEAAAYEERALAAASAGTASEIVLALQDGGRLFSLCNVAEVPHADAVVPVLSAAPAIPVGTAPGATGTSSDSTAALAGQSFTLKPWYCTCAVPMNTMISLDFAAKFPKIAARAFNAAIDKMVCVGAGTGNDGLGVFTASASGVPTGSDVECGASGVPKLTDLIGIITDVLAQGADPATTVLIVNPAFVEAALLETTAGTIGLQVEIATRGTLGGVRVVASSYAPAVLTAGSYVGVAIDLATYSIAIAQAIQIDEIKTVGSDNVALQSFLYMNGAPSLGSMARRLKTK